MRNKIYLFVLFIVFGFALPTALQAGKTTVKKDRLAELYESPATSATQRRLIGHYLEKRAGRLAIKEKRRAMFK